MFNSLRGSIAVLVCFFVCLEGWSRVVPFVPNLSGEQSAIRTEYLLDYDNKITFQNIIGQASSSFRKFNNEVPNFGFTNANVWLKFSISNPTSEPIFLIVNYPFLKELVLYSSEFPQGIVSGEQKDFQSRFLKINSFNFRLDIPQGSTQDFYLKVNSDYILLLPLQFYSLKNLMEEKHLTDMLQGIYFGIIFVMILYNLFIYFSVKDPAYLWYVLYTASIGMLNAVIQEVAFEYLFPSVPILNQYTILIPGVTCLMAIAFSYSFLNINKTMPTLRYALAFPGVILICSMLLGIMGFRVLCGIAMLTGSLILPIILFVTGLISYLRGFKPAFFYLLAWGGFLLLAMIYLLASVGVLPFNYFTVNAMEYGSGGEMVLLSLALANKINFYKKEAELAQLAVLRSEQQMKSELESLVAVRTAEIIKTQDKLSEAIEELQAVNSNLESIVNSRTEELKSTNIELKNALDELDTFMYRSAHDLRGPVARINGLTQLVQKRAIDANSPEFIHFINENTTNMGRILDKFSMLNKINMGDYVTEFTPFEVIEEVTAVFSNEMREKGVTLHVSGGKRPVRMDRDAFYNIVYISVENSIGFSKPNSSQISNVVIQLLHNHDSLEYFIWDNGIGINGDLKEKIFDMFFRGTDQSKGNGLGLYVTKKALEKSMGKVSIETEENQFTQFSFIFPLL